ncbi:MAG TPA: glutamate ABC transporter substrate-binding protein [Thermoleophilaceae bacterium]|nr:glutamate ABC transporter substrate-binding protein [Thermoleophilaceae bacterium]
MKGHRWLLLLAALLVIGLVAVGCGDDDDDESADTTETTTEQRSFEPGTTMARLQEEGTIRIGVKYDVPPFGFRNPQNDEIEGFDVDLGKAVADALGVEVEFVEAISDNRIPFITDGTVDLVFSTMTINEERALEIGFTDPYFIAHGRILVPKDSDIRGVEDLGGTTVCTALGSTYEETLREQAPDAELRLVDTYSECLELLQNGAIDAISTDDVILTGMIIQDDSLKLVGEELTVEPYGGGFKKDDDEFGEFLNEVITEYKADGRWQERYDFWLGRHTGVEQTPPDATLQDALEGNIE